MKIAMMTNNYMPFVGGVPISIDRLARSLRERGHHVDVYAPMYDEQQMDEEGVIRYKSFRKHKGTDFRVPYVLDKAIEQGICDGRYDLIHVHHPMMVGYAALYLARKYDIPLALTYHTRYEQYIHYIRALRSLPKAELIVRKHNRIFTNACDLVFAPSASMRDYLAENGTRTQIRVMPTGLTEDDFSIDTEKARHIRNTYGPNGETLFCCVARLEQEKNIAFLLKSMAAYKQTSDTPFKLLLIGKGSQLGELTLQTQALGLEDNVVFVGCVDHAEVSSWCAACDAFVFASQSETQGIVLLEAMAAGLPVVAVEASGVNDVVEHGDNGLICPQNPDVFAKSMHIVTHPDFHPSMQIAAQRTALNYTADRIASLAESSYAQLLERKEANRIAYTAV